LKKDDDKFADAEKLRKTLIKWFYEHGRDFPWRDKSALDPYKVLVTEILLQKTKAETVAEMWYDFFKVFPTVKELAKSTEDHVLKLIRCLGLAYRAKRLIKISRQIIEEFNGFVPSSFDKLLRLHGIGPYAASAVLCFAYGEPQPIVDVNVMRMMNRFRGFMDEKSIREYISKAIPQDQPREFNWGLLDIAATICKPDKPNCFACPLDPLCPKLNAQMSKWRIMRKNVRGDVKLSLQPYSVRKKKA
jgi:A/G-specific adenine glycosylase